MKSVKIIICLFLMIALPISSFAVGHGSTPPRPAHSSGHHGGPGGHPGHHSRPSHHRHHNYHGYYYGGDYYTRDAFWAFLGFSALTAIAVAASTSKKKKEKVVVIEEKEEEPEEDLTITAEQQAQLQKLFDENKDNIAKLRTEKDLKTTALEKEKSKAKPDEATIASLENEISQLSMNIFRVTQNTKKQIQTILTPAQYEQYEDIRL